MCTYSYKCCRKYDAIMLWYFVPGILFPACSSRLIRPLLIFPRLFWFQSNLSGIVPQSITQSTNGRQQDRESQIESLICSRFNDAYWGRFGSFSQNIFWPTLYKSSDDDSPLWGKWTEFCGERWDRSIAAVDRPAS